MVDFKQDRAIYLQMAERICDEILAGKYHSDDRIPSVREQAIIFEVNTNTVVKTYDLLLQWGIIYTRRGLGYFVTTKPSTGRTYDMLNNSTPIEVGKIFKKYIKPLLPAKKSK